MQSFLPPPPPSVGGVPNYLIALSRALFDMFRSVISQNEPAERVMLRDHVDGSIWFITVESGTIVLHPASDLPEDL
ncbi:MAG: hypothetical protein IKE60_26410 [Reyranella sp.]|uniref:hypothetical protein n=1 Tax=Reyranella sp. TaxID=1929291 RepID=UPI0025E16BA2|nr:hypothetical protein [Reyranella sp.]MBR2818223.1 hypothetical protein [Reyranella sp.]